MDEVELSLPPAPTAATQARTEVTERLASRLGASVLEDVRLLVTELITNALRHGKLTPGDRVSVKASVDDGVVRIEVARPRATTAMSRPASQDRAVAATGSILVEQLAKRWGVDRRDGTVVWCELAPGTAR